MTKSQRAVAIILTSICLLAIVARHLWPCILIDERTIFLLALGSLPWLSLFFKKFKIPGLLEGETHDRTQSTTEKPIPPAVNVQISQQTHLFSAHAMKILATLWRYQRQHFKDDFSKRWTFAVFPNAVVYPSYLTGIAELLNAGLVAVLTDNYQVLLTNEGISYIQQHDEVQNYKEVYTF
ncbi:MAG TPA: hypothetical protein VLH59_06765 [Ignavibacteriaceae bacterium]|nr:hypothetical protein [Ignavibacteriaceae bacterium]